MAALRQLEHAPAASPATLPAVRQVRPSDQLVDVSAARPSTLYARALPAIAAPDPLPRTTSFLLRWISASWSAFVILTCVVMAIRALGWPA